MRSYYEFLKLNSEEKVIITVVGSGGKTTIISEIAEEAVTKGKTVLITTTTKIFIPTDHHAVTIFDSALLRKINPLKPSILYGGKLDSNPRKLSGFGYQELEQIGQNPYIDMILIEGDGSAGRPIKAHQRHEPVVPEYSDILIAVMGLSALNQEINEKNVHRVHEFIERVQKAINTKMSADDMLTLLIHEDGYFKYKCPKNYLIFNALNETNLKDFQYIKSQLLQKVLFIDDIEGREEKH